MSTQKSKNAITIKKDVPRWELTADEVVWPLEFDSILAFFHCDAQTSPFELKTVLGSNRLEYKQSGTRRARERVIHDPTEACKFVLKHFRDITSPLAQEDATTEQKREWFEANPQIQVRVFMEGYDNVFTDDADAPTKLTFDVSPETRTHANRVAYSPSVDDVVRVKFVHVARRETEQDRIKHRKAVKLQDRGPREWVNVNLDVVEQLYNDLIRSVEGYLIGGKACTAENKDEWVGLIPLTDKLFVVSQIFSATTLKNA